MDKASKYLQVLTQKHLDAKARLQKARDLYQSTPTEFEPPELGRMLWNDYKEAMDNFLWIDQLLRDYGVRPTRSADSQDDQS